MLCPWEVVIQAELRSLRHGNELIGGTDGAVVTVVFGAMENHGPGFSIPK